MPRKRKDRHTPEQRSYNMSRIRSKGSAVEMKLYSLLDQARINYEKHPKLFGKPEAFIKPNILLFADGDFWHGWHFYKWKNNLSREYWGPKIEGNIRRDRQVNRKLRMEGYIVVRVWEHTIMRNPEKAIEKIKDAISK